MTLADRIVLMRNGEIVQVSAPMEVYDNPTNKFSAGFIGAPKIIFFNGSLVPEHGGGSRLAVPAAGHEAYGAVINQAVELEPRPEHLGVDAGPTPAAAQFEAEIDVVEPMGSEALAFFRLDGVKLAAKCDPHDPPAPMARTTLTANMSKMRLIETRATSWSCRCGRTWPGLYTRELSGTQL